MKGFSFDQIPNIKDFEITLEFEQKGIEIAAYLKEGQDPQKAEIIKDFISKIAVTEFMLDENITPEMA